MKTIPFYVILLLLLIGQKPHTSCAQSSPCPANHEKAEQVLEDYLSKERNIQDLREDYDIPKNAFKYEVSDEMIFFEKIISSFLEEESASNEPLLVEVRPLRTDTTMTKQEWNKWLEGQNKLITSREEILANKNLEKVDIEVYQSCGFPPQMVPPQESEPDVELAEQCKDLENKQALKVSLSQDFQDDENGGEQRKVRAVLFLNYGHIEYEFLFSKENQKWVVAEKKRVSGILSILDTKSEKIKNG